MYEDADEIPDPADAGATPETEVLPSEVPRPAPEAEPERLLYGPPVGPVPASPALTGSRGLPRPMRRHPVASAVAISILVHAILLVGGYLALRSLHLFVPARPESPEGDGGVETGLIDHDGSPDLAAGAAGMGAPQINWSGFHGSSGGPSFDPAFDPAGLHTVPPAPPASEPPQPKRELIEAEDAPPPPPVIERPDPLDPDTWPDFPRQPPQPAEPPAEAPPAPTPPAPPQPAPAPADARPTPAAASGAAGSADAPQAADAGGATGSATAAGYSVPGAGPGGLLRRNGTGGSGGAGGATTGSHGSAVTGHPGIRGNAPRPVYPALSKQLNEHGTVMLDVEVLEDGRVGSIRVVSDAGHRRLADAAIDAVRETDFTPAIENGRPVRKAILCPYVFELR